MFMSPSADLRLSCGCRFIDWIYWIWKKGPCFLKFFQPPSLSACPRVLDSLIIRRTNFFRNTCPFRFGKLSCFAVTADELRRKASQGDEQGCNGIVRTSVSPWICMKHGSGAVCVVYMIVLVVTVYIIMCDGCIVVNQTSFAKEVVAVRCI